MRFMAIASVVCASVEMEAERHRAGGEALTISLAGSTSSSGTGAGRLDLEQAAQVRWRVWSLIIGVFLVRSRTCRCARRMLQLAWRRASRMVLAADQEGILAAGVEHVGQTDRCRRPAGAAHGFLGDFEQADAFDIAGGAGEILVDEGGGDRPMASKICAPV